MSDIRKFFDLCYVDGSPDGVVRCQFADTQYVAYRFPRERFEDLRKTKNKDNILEHLEYKGVYFLLTYSDVGKLAQVYVGKAGERADDRLGLLNRIYEHRKDKYRNWTEAVLLTTKGNDWSATELNYLENGFFQLVQERLGQGVCINAATPTASQPTYQQQHALDGLMQVYAPECFRVMGIPLVMPHEKKKCSAKSANASAPKKSNENNSLLISSCQLFRCKSKKVKAFGCLTKKCGPKGFTVKAGSYISLKPQASFLKECAYATWKGFVEGPLVDHETGRLKADYEFKSPSLASTIVKAGNSNGWTEWINDNGEPLDVLRK